MKPMKTDLTVPYNSTGSIVPYIKKILVGVAFVAVPIFTSCEKDPVKPNDNDNNNNQPPKTYTYIYDNNGIPKDTVLTHTDVDTFYVIPTRYDLFAGSSENGVHTVRNHLENCTLLNSKTHGKGDLKVRNASATDSAWLSQFGYNVQR